jgi:hypothetical protein
MEAESCSSSVSKSTMFVLRNNNYDCPLGWEAEGSGRKNDVECQSLRNTLKRVVSVQGGLTIESLFRVLRTALREVRSLSYCQ